MILQSDLSQTIPMTAAQMQMIMDSQEIYRKRLVKELIGLHIDGMKRFKGFDWNYDDLKADYEKRNYIRYYTGGYSDLPIYILERKLEEKKQYFYAFEKCELENPIIETAKSFNYKYIYCVYYLIILKIDEEYLSSQYITLFAIESTKEIREKQNEIEEMKKEHFKKYGNWWEKIIQKYANI